MLTRTRLRTWRRRAAVAALAFAAPAVAGPRPAEAAPPETVVARVDALVTVTAGAGVANRVILSVDAGELVVADAAVAVAAGDGCAGGGLAEARCDLAGVTEVRVVLGDQNDVLAKPTPLPVPLLYDGGEGNDTFVAATVADGADTFLGGAGADTVSYAQRSARVTVRLDGVADDGAAGEGDDVGSDVETVFGGTGDDLLVGSDAPNTLSAGTGNDVVDGRGGGDAIVDNLGDDSYAGGEGADVFSTTVDLGGADDFSGGPGIDIVSYGARGDRQSVRVTLDDVDDDGFDGEHDNVRTDVENVAGSGAADTL
ncbi:MAG: calcium-binding protein, partial [Acidimicrobiales bacterium]